MPPKTPRISHKAETVMIFRSVSPRPLPHQTWLWIPNPDSIKMHTSDKAISHLSRKEEKARLHICPGK
jgi:hypothetical protein